MKEVIGYKDRSEFYQFELVDTVDVPFIKSMINENTNKIMEIPCGTGRIAFEIANANHLVTAADIEPEMVEQFTERLKNHRKKDYITAIVADMCFFDFEDKFDLIVVPREAFQLITGYENAIKALKNMHKHLNYGGKIIIDLFPFGAKIKPLTDIALRPDYYDYEIPDGKFVVDWSKEIEPWIVLTRLHGQLHRSDCITEVTYRFQKNDQRNNTIFDDQIMTIELQNYTTESFEKICDQADVIVNKLYGNYERKAYEPGDPRMLYVLT
ncbi:class I SAM-dependent methyltransferase [Acetobacterium malicum]|uniref:class I SAM-dependent methyltransferase n=1 Tax=Acetobacterium malicum TaxID=52692 RepID=UPI00041614F5|nr:class I SAM-dependent methyltransferase [Acetobacterium dehalogenans]